MKSPRTTSGQIGILLLVCLFGFTLPSPLQADDDDAGVDADLLYSRALIAYEKQAFKISMSLCREALEKNPNKPETHNLLGALFVEARDFKRAKLSFQRSHRLNPNPNTSFNLAEIDFITSKWDESKKKFDELLAHNDTNEEYKPLIRFKLLIVSLQQSDNDSLQGHLDFFKANRMQRELDFHQILIKIHSDKLKEEDARELWNPLAKMHENTAPLIDSILETYYLPDGEKN